MDTGEILKENRILIDHWDQVFTRLKKEEAGKGEHADPPGFRTLAPAEKLFQAACSLGCRKRVLDYGCGTAWAGIAAAKSGCPDVTAADPAPGAVRAAEFYAALYGVQERVHPLCITNGWLHGVPAETFDGLFCSNVLDVVPPETAEEIIRETARIVTADADIFFGLNYYMSPERAAEKGVVLAGGNRLYMDGVLRLVSRTDEAWADLFSAWYDVIELDHFAWPQEKTETRRLFHLKKRRP